MNLRDATSALGSGIPLSALKGDADSLDRSEFEDRHGSAFFLLTAADLALSRGPDSTDVRLVDEHRSYGESTASLRLTVFPLRARDGSPVPLVTLGRASDSDVAIPDKSISRFHAFARKTGDGEWRVYDAGSTNGTGVDGRHAPVQGEGDPLALKTGSTLRLGQVELTFLDLDAILAYLAQL